MSTRVPTLDAATLERERHDLRTRLRTIDDATPNAALLQLAHACVDRGLPDDAIHLLDTRALHDTDAARWVRCRALWDAGRRDQVVALADRCADRAAAGDLESSRVQVRAAWSDLLAGRPAPDLAAIRRHADRNQGPAPLLADLAHLDAYVSLTRAADLPVALGEATLAAELYAATDDVASEVKARVLLARVQAIAGRLQSAAHDARRAVERARASADPRLMAQALIALGIALFRRGEWAGSERALVRSEEIALAFGEERWRAAALLHLARLHVVHGAVDRAEETLARITDEALAANAVSMHAVADEYRGMVRAASGEPHAALELFDRALRRIDASGIVSYERAELHLRRAEVMLEMDRFDEAWTVAHEALADIEQSGQWLERGHLLRVIAIAADATGRPREAAEARDRAERALRRTGDRHELARCLLDRARARFDGEERRREAAAEAAHLFRALDLNDLALECAEQEAAIATSTPRATDAVDEAASFGPGLIAVSAEMKSLLGELVTAAASDGPVLLQGETGTGKEVLARALHERSARADAVFVPVNCSAIPESLFEREFFGHVRGAYTGADREAPGLVEAADGGTLFLDEIGEMPVSVQPKLLRLLQEGTFRRVGDVKERTVDLRIVAATNRGLFDLAQQGEFREDLYYRLSWFELAIPPLRERPDDIVALAQAFLARERRRAGRTFWMERAVWRVLRRHGWPGNVRQLESAVASSCARSSSGGRIGVEQLPAQVRGERSSRRPRCRDVDLARSMERYERELIVDALRRSGQRRTEAARLLGIGRNTLYEKMKRLGIKPEAPGRAA